MFEKDWESGQILCEKGRLFKTLGAAPVKPLSPLLLSLDLLLSYEGLFDCPFARSGSSKTPCLQSTSIYLPPSPYPTLSHCSQMAYLPLEWDLALFKIHFSTRGFLLCKCLFSLFGNFLHGLRAADVTRQRLHRHLLPVFLLALGGGTCALVVSLGLLHRSVHYSSLSISAIDVSHFNKSYHAVTANSLGLAGLPIERIFKILETG